jgi:hypothetical protein
MHETRDRCAALLAFLCVRSITVRQLANLIEDLGSLETVQR